MAKHIDVLMMLIPDGGYYAVGEDYEGITFLECEPITKAEYEAGFATYDVWKAKQEADRAASKSALLERLGITAEEATLLLS
jgi:hypothetical protein